MMTRLCLGLSCLLLAFTFFSCAEKTPDGILSKKQMVRALTEFYLKEAKVTALGVSPDSAAVLMEYYKIKYAEKQNFPDSSLDASYQYYLSRPQILDVIYDQVIDSLVVREQKAVTPTVVQ